MQHILSQVAIYSVVHYKATRSSNKTPLLLFYPTPARPANASTCNPPGFTCLMQDSSSGIGNLSLVAGQTQTLQGMAGRNNFSPIIPFILLLMMLIKLGYLWNCI